jgi:hypothetical protein
MAKRSDAAHPRTAAKEHEPRASIPTPLPAFDMEQYARESDQTLRIADETPTCRPRAGHSGVVDVAPPSIEVDESLSDDDAELVYWARIGDDSRVPYLARSLEALLGEMRASSDGPVLWAIDGASNVREVVAASGLPRLVALQTLCDLLDRGIVAFVS